LGKLLLYNITHYFQMLGKVHVLTGVGLKVAKKWDGEASIIFSNFLIISFLPVHRAQNARK